LLLTGLSLSPPRADQGEASLEACQEVSKSCSAARRGSTDLLDKAECVAVIPSTKKFAIGVGGRHGRGAVVCAAAVGAERGERRS